MRIYLGNGNWYFISKKVDMALNIFMHWIPNVVAMNLRFPNENTSKSRKVRFLLRSIFLGKTSRIWYLTVLQSPILFALFQRQRDVLERVHRPYSRRYMIKQDVIKLLCGHYDFMQQVFKREILSEMLLTDRGVGLAKVHGKNGSVFSLVLRHDQRYSKEGELSISIWDEEQIELTVLTFSIFWENGYLKLLIGGLQGGRGEDIRSRIREATRALSHLQPRYVLMEALFRFAESIGVSRIEGVSSHNHVYRSMRYRRKKIRMDYDCFWKSLGGEINNNGDFNLNMSQKHHAVADVKSSKRSQQKRKLEILENIHSQVDRSLKDWIV